MECFLQNDQRLMDFFNNVLKVNVSSKNTKNLHTTEEAVGAVTTYIVYLPMASKSTYKYLKLSYSK